MIDGPRLAPANGGRARKLVVFLHGYGADGNDLIDIGRYWAPLLPHVAFVSPHAPDLCTGVPMGRQWCPLQLRDRAEIAAGLLTAAPILDAFIDAELAAHNLTAADLALVGFSQGAMLALHVGPARPKPLAGIVSYSGLIARPVNPANPGKPPILLYHGTEDALIPARALNVAEAALTAAGLPVEAELRPGLGHGIDPNGLELGGRFLARAFGEGS